MGECSPLVYTLTVSLCTSHGRIFTLGVHRDSFTMYKSWANFHPWCTPWQFHYVQVMGERSPLVYTVTVSLCTSHGQNFHPWCTPWQFHYVLVMGESSPLAYTVTVSLCTSHEWIFHPLCKQCKSSSLNVCVKFHHQYTGRKFYSNIRWRLTPVKCEG